MNAVQGRNGPSMERAGVEDVVIEHQIAKRIKAHRTARGLTLRELSALTNLSQGLLSKIENCVVSPPISTLAKLAHGHPHQRVF